MPPAGSDSARLVLLGVAFFTLFAVGAPGQEAGKFPSAALVAQLLQREPLSEQTWPAWRDRLRSWLGDRSQGTDAAFEAARDFLSRQAAATGELPPSFAQDAIAHYLLGNSYLFAAHQDRTASWQKAERAYRRSIAIDPNIANAHRNLARVLIFQVLDARYAPSTRQLREAAQELDKAKQLEPNLPYLKGVQAELAEAQGRYADAEKLLRQEMEEDPPQAADLACEVARLILSNRQQQAPAQAIKPLLDRYPSHGPLICFYAVGLARQGEERQAAAELQRARALGTDPATILSAEVISKIEAAGTPGWIERLAWIMLYFAGFYAILMAIMAMAGMLLAGRTRGAGALQLLGSQTEEFVSGGQVIRTQQESQLAKFYMLALMAGLVLFYLSIPFIVGGVLALTGGLLYLIFMMPRIPLKLIVIVVVVGGGMAWAVLKSVFARPGRGSFGLLKKPEDCPKLYAVINEVARKVDTDAVHELYVAPGSSIGVHQEGRGPFGMFGVKSRVLTLGLSTMHFLTVSELQAILAHEYAHFSHRDTFYSRFIYQVQLSIDQALSGMGQAGGKLNYVNPFYWFLYLYYKAYSLLSAGFSRSREFLADRMAVTLYGSDVFVSALKKVATDGTLFEMTMYDQVQGLLAEQKAFTNMYAAFRDYRDQGIKPESREELYTKILEEQGSLFASHPTFKERLEAVATLPRGQQVNSNSALGLFENPEEMEKELTEFMTGFFGYLQELRAQAEAAQPAQ